MSARAEVHGRAGAGRLLGPTVILTAAVAGLSWSPTFAPTALLVPVVLPLLAVLAGDQLTLGRRGASVVRPVAGLVLGAVVLVLAFRLLGGASVTDVVHGVAGGWRRTLGSTLPARPEAELMAFVPALALLAAVLGTEWTRRDAGPLPTLLPALCVLGLGQLVRAATGWQAFATVVAFGAAAAAVLLAHRRRARQVPRRRTAAPVGRLLATIAVAALAAGVASGVGLPGQPTFTLQDVDPGDTDPLTAPDPLEQIAARLATPDRPAFTVRTDSAVDRWPLVVLDRFDGTNWTTSARFRELGTELPPPPVAAPVVPAQAQISDLRLDGPWLPSQQRLRAADGIRPRVDQATGTLVRADAGHPAAPYVLRWDCVRVTAEVLTSSAVDPDPVGALEVTEIPAKITELAREAVGPDAAPTVQVALMLEGWMRGKYDRATGDHLPTGHSTAQLLHFLTESEYGTSEQFAPAYALLARSLGIPVRVVVGFRAESSGTVQDGDILAWPEIAVRGLGWVPLDPTGEASSRTSGDDLAAATQAARNQLPPPGRPPAPQPADPPPPDASTVTAPPGALPWWPLVVVALAAVAGVPAAKHVRRRLRRRSPPRAAVVNAWRDTRDILRDHGVAVPPGGTVRDLGSVAPVDPADVAALARCVDHALWTGRDTDPALADQAWAAAAAIRRSLRDRPWRHRLRAVYAVRSLR